MAEDLIFKQKINVALVTNVYQQATVGFVASFLCGTLTFINIYQIQNPLYVFSWYAFFILMIVLHATWVRQFFKNKHIEKNILYWRNLFILGTSLSGISWGLICTPFLFPHQNMVSELFILIIISGISAGAVPILAPLRTATCAFLILTLAPLIISFYFTERENFLLFNAAFSIFLVYLIILTFKTHHVIRHSFTLQFENDVLLKELSEAKNQLEISNEKLKKAAMHDPLTNIANRSLFELNFTESISKAKQNKHAFALLYLDLDNFKEVNDIYGHAAGDHLLLIIATRIKHVLKNKDIVFRLGGDELTIILNDIPNVNMVANIAERICEVVSKPLIIENKYIQIYASIGISIFPADGDNMDTLLRAADTAMYYVKDHGGNSFHFYTSNYSSSTAL